MHLTELDDFIFVLYVLLGQRFKTVAVKYEMWLERLKK